MGLVYLARQRDLDRLVALKALHSIHVNAASFAERFVRESRLAGSLSHPNIVTVYEYFEADETPYIAMEYVSRGSLRTWDGSLSTAQLVGVLEGLLAGLSAVEPSGIVHRDLKPENVMVTADGRVKITDFGIAKATESAGDPRITSATTGATLGTPAYMAPEQALSEIVGPWTDLYSVGVIAYEQLVGHVPFHDSRAPMAVLLRHINEPIPPAVQSNPDLDPALSAWVDRLLVKDPRKRTSNATQAWEELEEIVIAQLGPRWRRDARLLPGDVRRGASEPLTPARFDTHLSGVHPSPAPLLEWSHTVPSPSPSGELVSLPASASGRSRRARAPRLLLASLAAVAMVILGFAIAPAHGGGRSGEPLSEHVANRTLSVSYPASWRARSTAAVDPGVTLSEPLALAGAGDRGALVIGGAQTTSSTLLPSELLASVRGTPRGEAIRLGGFELYRYRDLMPRGAGKPETVYALPTTVGVVLGACELPAHGVSATNAECERILATLELIKGSLMPLGPSHSYAAALSSAIDQLNATQVKLRSQLASAVSAGAQATAAGLLAKASDRAAAALRHAAPGPAERAANASILAALASSGDAYATMARGARSESSAVFGQGRHDVASAARALAGALARLAPAGYELSS
jgi:serine/threonine protein kinase